MLLRETLRDIVISQREAIQKADSGVPREILSKVELNTPHALIISGIRRCGKSTLLKQIMERVRSYWYFNFEDPRVVGFDVSDFERLEAALREIYGEADHIFLDEVQNVVGWERFVRALQDRGKKFVITGSNASLLSRELGTRLTGRHLLLELFPFSYREMLSLKKLKPNPRSFNDYLKHGGMPEYLVFGKEEMLQHLFVDVLARDIVVRYGLRNLAEIKALGLYLISNVGKEFSYNRLRASFGLGSTTTVISYISYLEDSYLFFSMPKQDYSFRRQMASPKKGYAIDNGLARVNSVSFSEDRGRALENAVFLELRRENRGLYYYKNLGECDFLVGSKGKIVQAIQVCARLTKDNQNRELGGLRAAMKEFGLKMGLVITEEQEDSLGNIMVVPAWKWMGEQKVYNP